MDWIYSVGLGPMCITAIGRRPIWYDPEMGFNLISVLFIVSSRTNRSQSQKSRKIIGSLSPRFSFRMLQSYAPRGKRNCLAFFQNRFALNTASSCVFASLDPAILGHLIFSTKVPNSISEMSRIQLCEIVVYSKIPLLFHWRTIKSWFFI